MSLSKDENDDQNKKPLHTKAAEKFKPDTCVAEAIVEGLQTKGHTEGLNKGLAKSLIADMSSEEFAERLAAGSMSLDNWIRLATLDENSLTASEESAVIDSETAEEVSLGNESGDQQEQGI